MAHTHISVLCLLALFALVAVAENTTTTVTTSTTATTKLSTSSGITNTTAIPSTTPSVTMAPSGDAFVNGLWSVPPCITLNAAMQLWFYMAGNSNDSPLMFNVDPNATVVTDSHCGNKTQLLHLNFYDDWSLKMTFEMKDDNRVYLTGLGLSLKTDKPHFPSGPGKTYTASAANLTLFGTDKNTSYMCNSQVAQVNLTSDTTTFITAVQLVSKNAQVQAFADKNTFNNVGSQCTDDLTSNLVPIIVGAALVGLVIIVLIAYLIGRRRHSRGYESV